MIDAVSVVGLGHLGAPMAACFAASGFQVIGIDNNPASVERMNQHLAPVQEPGLQELLTKHSDRVGVSTDISVAATETDITFIAVPTPSKTDGTFDLKDLLEVCGSLAYSIHGKPAEHFVVIASTVMPGACNGQIAQVLCAGSDKALGVDLHLVYNPQFIALGSVISNFFNPDLCLIGESDKVAGDAVAHLYTQVHNNSPHVARMNLVNAELTKLAVNTFVTTKISFANMLARICEKTPGGNSDVVTQALGSDSRIGRKFLKGAIGYGGPCFPRDNKALATAARKAGVTATIAEATDSFNSQQTIFLENLVQQHLPDNGTVSILGLAYKPNTDVVAESQGIILAQALTRQGIEVHVHDPLAVQNAAAVLGDTVTFSDNAVDCVAAGDVVVITTHWAEFTRIPWQTIKTGNSTLAIIDCWGILRRADLPPHISLIPLGKDFSHEEFCKSQPC